MSSIVRRFQAALVVAAAVVTFNYTYTYADLSPEWVARWKADLEYARAQAVEKHPNLFNHLSREDWAAAFDALIARLPTLDHAEVAVELAVIMAKVRDGHTRFTVPLGPNIEFMQGHSNTPDPMIDALVFHQFPIRFLIDDDGVHVCRIGRRYARVVGGKVVRIGSLDTDDAVAAVSPVVRRDNEMQLRHHLPMFLVLSEVLAARGVIEEESRLPLTVELTDGNATTVELASVPHGETVGWVDARVNGTTPLYLQHPEENFWFTRVDDSPILYMQFNEVYDTEEESIAEFADRLADAIARERTEALIVDLRHNRGGDMSLSRPLLHAILCAGVNEPGRLFTLVGRTTFSAAMMFALEMERHTVSLFVGEPTGSTPNHYGDSRKILLPNTGLTLRVSTRYHQNDFTDNRPWITPHLPAPVTMGDYAAGRDPALQLVRTIVADSFEDRPASGRWEGRATVGLNTFNLTIDIDGDGGTMSIAELGATTPLKGLNVRGADVSFAIDDPGGRPIRFEGSQGNRWMTGILGGPSRRYPFVLRRP